MGFSLAHIFWWRSVFVPVSGKFVDVDGSRWRDSCSENSVWFIDPPSINESFGGRSLEICGVLCCDGSKV